MKALLRYFIFRDLKSHKVRSILTTLGIALGVAAFVSMILINRSLLISFERAIDAIAGKAKLELTGPKSGFDEKIIKIVQDHPGVKNAVPIIQTNAFVTQPKGGALMILGVDPFQDNAVRSFELEETEEDPLLLLVKLDSILLSKVTAERLGVGLGEKIQLATAKGIQSFTVRGLLKLEGPVKALGGQLAVMDILAAQIAFGKEGKIDRIDIVLDEKADVNQVEQSLQEKVGTLQVGVPRLRGEELEKNLFFLRASLFSLGALAIFVGVFLIFNTMSTAVVQRRHEIGVIRSIGATRRSLLWTISAESLLYGITGGVIGLVGGLLLAKGMIGAVSQSVSAIYSPASFTEVQPSIGILLLGFLVSILVTFLSGLYPALQASRVSPLEAIQEYSAERSVRLQGKRGLQIGLSLLVLSIGTARLQPEGGGGPPIFGTIGQAGILLSIILMMPSLIRGFGKGMRILSIHLFGASTLMAAENLPRRSWRTSVTVVALMISLAIMTHTAIVLQSFKESLTGWLRDVVPADLFITSGSVITGPLSNPLTIDLAEEFRSLPEVEAINRVRLNPIPFEGREIDILAFDLETAFRYHDHLKTSKYYIEGSRERALKLLASEKPYVVVSENFSRKFNYHLGDVITLNTPKGKRNYEIAGVVIEFSSNKGVVYFDWTQYLPLWEDRLVDIFDLYLTPGANPYEVRDTILSRWGAQYPIIVTAKQEFYQEANALIDQSFSVAYALQAVALMIALAGIINTLLAAVLDRTREIGVIRALGATRVQARRMILEEAVMIGLLGSMVGIATGSLTSAIDLFVTIKQTLGMTIHYSFPIGLPVTAVCASILTAAIAGLYPAHRAAKINPIEAMRYE